MKQPITDQVWEAMFQKLLDSTIPKQLIAELEASTKLLEEAAKELEAQS